MNVAQKENRQQHIVQPEKRAKRKTKKQPKFFLKNKN